MKRKKDPLLKRIKVYLLHFPVGQTLLRLKRTVLRRLKGTPRAAKQSDSPLAAGLSSARTAADLNPAFCSGCGACFNACPSGAIEMIRDSEGYLIPSVDAARCAGCGTCVSVCPVLHTKKENRPAPPCYAVLAEDEIRRDSSSGGAFSLLAEHVLRQGGYVCGAAMDEAFQVRHILIHSVDELPKLRRAKYVQSDTGDVFSRIRRLLDEGAQVLFSGCPCQAAGLKAFLGEDRPGLVTVDLVCRGVPPQPVFDRYLEETYGKDALERFEFRTKKFGYSGVHQIAYTKDGREIPRSLGFDAYEQCVHSGIAVKKICADCPFASAPRQGDITIGDLWDAGRFGPGLSDGLGASMVLCNSARGDALWDPVRGRCRRAVAIPFKKAFPAVRPGRHADVPPGREVFFTMLKTRRFEDALFYALKGKFDVGVIGLWYGVNYGSMLTYYSLNTALKAMGLSVLMIEDPSRPLNTDEEAKQSPYRLARMFYHISERCPMEKLDTLNGLCDSFILGSDQLWNVGISRPYKQTYFLDFAAEERKKISVATSFAKPYMGTDAEKLISSYHLRRFDHVSVRDELSRDICRDWGVEAEVLCDPAFYCGAGDYEPLERVAALQVTEKYLFAYILDPDEDSGRVLHEIARAAGYPVYVVPDLHFKTLEAHRKMLTRESFPDVILKENVDVFEWLWYYRHCEAVITDSYHGTVFSVIYRKPFLSRINRRRGAARFESLGAMLQIRDRMFETFPDGPSAAALLRHMDYTVPASLLEKKRAEALSWIQEAIRAPKEISSRTVYEYVSGPARRRESPPEATVPRETGRAPER